MNSSLRLTPALRLGESVGRATKTQRRFFDFVVDGVSLHSKCLARGYDEIGCLGWGTSIAHSEARARLVGDVPGDFADGRVALFVCPECGDLGCGAVSARIRRAGRSIIWEEIGWQTNYEEGWHPIEDLGPYSFDFEGYRAAIEATTLLESGPSGDFVGMTLNERLHSAGLLDEFDSAARRRDRDALVALLSRIDLPRKSAEESVEALLGDPAKYGYPDP